MINETWYQLMVAGLVEERASPSGFLKGPCKLLRNAHNESSRNFAIVIF